MNAKSKRSSAQGLVSDSGIAPPKFFASCRFEAYHPRQLFGKARHHRHHHEGDAISTRRKQGCQLNETQGNRLAERVGFEPTSRLLVNTLSKRAPSATRTPLRGIAPRLLLGAKLPDHNSDSRQPNQYNIGEAKQPDCERRYTIASVPRRACVPSHFPRPSGHLKRRRKRNSTPKTPFWSRTPSTETLSLKFHSNWMIWYWE